MKATAEKQHIYLWERASQVPVLEAIAEENAEEVDALQKRVRYLETHMTVREDN